METCHISLLSVIGCHGIYHNPDKFIWAIYECRLKSSKADDDALLECDQIRFIFQHNPPCGPRNSAIDAAVFGSHQSKKSSTVDITSSY